MSTAITAEGLSKLYRLGQLAGGYNTLRDQIAATASKLRHRDRAAPESRELWALRDVSFEIQQGEVVGLLGRNGAGKTTLLRVLSRITEPTAGTAVLNGRVGSLLELGTGFHPELTGRENVFLNGSILGMRRSEISKRFDEIVEFAGVQRFLDTPVKRYSSGMYVRLAFAVAAHLEPEILLVDEVLSVGDAEFQRRSLGKMEEVGQSGRTVVYVSHQMATIARLCPRSILLEDGSITMDGPTPEVIGRYLRGDLDSAAHRVWPADEAPGDEVARLVSARVLRETGETAETVDVRERVGIELTWDLLESVAVRPYIMLHNEQGLHAFNAIDTSPRWDSTQRLGRYMATAWIPGNFLNEGMMSVSAFVTEFGGPKTVHHAGELDALAFHVSDPVDGDSAKGRWPGQWHGAVRPLLEWSSSSE